MDGMKPLYLTLTGSCSEVTAAKEFYSFSAHVREKETKKIPIPNTTNMTGLIRPVIEGEYWTGPETLLLEPGITKNYEITYHPLTMTIDGKKHTVLISYLVLLFCYITYFK